MRQCIILQGRREWRIESIVSFGEYLCLRMIMRKLFSTAFFPPLANNLFPDFCFAFSFSISLNSQIDLDKERLFNYLYISIGLLCHFAHIFVVSRVNVQVIYNDVLAAFNSLADKKIT